MISNPHTGLKQFTLRYQYSSSVLVPESELFETCVGIGMGVAQIRNPVPEQDFSTRFWVWNWYRFRAVYRGRGPPGSPLRGAPVLVPRRRGPAASKGVAQRLRSKGVAQRLRSKGVAQRLRSKGVAQRLRSKGVAQRLRSKGVAQRLRSKGVAQRLRSKGVAQRLRSKGVAQRLRSKGVAQRLRSKGVAQRRAKIRVQHQHQLVLDAVT